MNLKKDINMDLDILVVDNTAFASGFNINIIGKNNPEVQIYMTPDVEQETTKSMRSQQIIDVAQSQGLLRIEIPSENSLKKVENVSARTGDSGALSKPDKSLIALSLDLMAANPQKRVFLMSDDYSIQNVCAQMIPPVSILKYSKKGISEAIVWETYCPSCYRTFNPSELSHKCPECNVRLKRKKKEKGKIDF